MRNAIAILLLISQCASSFAALGAAPTKFAGTQAGLNARVLSSDLGSYRRVDTTLASGTLVREYVTASGVVFAVSWNGPFLPDLRALLGKHFDTLASEAARRPKAGHAHISIDHPEVVVDSGGHMRAYAGRAWVPGLLPTGFTPDDIE